MKFVKFKHFIVIFLISIIFILCFLFYLKEARESNSWPFNAKIGKYFPPIIKKFVYDISNPNGKNIDSFYYNIDVEYSRIPYYESVGQGGSIIEFHNNLILLTLNDGQNFTYNILNNSFKKLNYNKFKNYFISIRDTQIIKSDNSNYLLILGVKELENKCRSLELQKVKINYKTDKNLIEFGKIKSIWNSDIKCENHPVIAFGSRVIFLDNHYFVTMGFVSSSAASGINIHSQDPNSMFGKILKISEDGNYTIYSSGHRNPQGLFFSKSKKQIFSTEHGPSGGDEINLILNNKNYGWPCQTYGILYDFKKNKKINEPWPKNINNCKENEFELPLFSWTPSIAISQGLEYNGEEFEYFNNDLILGSLKGSSLFRLKLDKNNVVRNIEKIYISERIRDIIQLNNGKLLIYADSGNLLLISKAKIK